MRPARPPTARCGASTSGTVPWARPAGWLHGTAEDLARTAELFLADGDPLITADSAVAMAAQMDTHWRPDGTHEVGYGQFTYPYKGVDVVMHDGWVSGFVSVWLVAPDHDFGVVVVANGDWADPYTFAYRALDAFLGLDPDAEWWPYYPMSPSDLDTYVGTYDDPWVWGRMDVFDTGTSLAVTFVDFGVTKALVGGQRDTFYFDHQGNRHWVRFIFDGGAQPRWFVTRVGVGERLGASGAQAGTGPQHPDAERLRAEGGIRCTWRPPTRSSA